MEEDDTIKTFNNKKIRTKWDKEIGDYYYSLIDVMEALTGSGNPERYWTLLKTSLSKDSNVLARRCIQLDISSNKDKSYFTDVATTNNLITILDNINCDKKDEFIRWLNQTRLQHLYDLNGTSYLLLYHGDEGTLFVESIFDGVNDTLWATQKAIAELFDVSKQSISSHFKDIFKVCELEKESVVSQIKMTASNGRKYKTNLYNLDAIMTVCYRINSDKSITFRKWATNRLKEYIVKGFILDEELLENGTIFNIDYFDYLLELIQKIQDSDRRFD